MSVLLAFVLAAATPTKAEIGGASGVKERQGLHYLGQCVVAEYPSEVRKLLAMNPDDKAYSDRAFQIANKHLTCTQYDIPPGVFLSGTSMMVASFSEAMMRRDKILEDLPARTAYRPELPLIAARHDGEFLAFCVVRTNAAATAALLRTEPATSEEFEALKAIGPTLSGCVPKDKKAQFTRETLRGMLAISAYRLALHNDRGGGSSREAAE